MADITDALNYMQNLMMRKKQVDALGSAQHKAYQDATGQSIDAAPVAAPAAVPAPAPPAVPPAGAIGQTMQGQQGLAPATTTAQRAQGIAALVARGIPAAQAAAMIDTQMRK